MDQENLYALSEWCEKNCCMVNNQGKYGKFKWEMPPYFCKK